MAHPDRSGGGGLSARTLAIASAASLTAAIVVSRLFPPGTIYASALTPVIVAAVSEILNRPADRVSELRRQRRTMVMEASRAPQGEEAGALRGAPDFARGADAEEELAVTGNGTGEVPPIRIHGRTRSRVLHPKVWIATGLVAFGIAVAVVTLPELIFGGAVANNHRTTIFGGGGGSESTKTETTQTKTDTQPQQTVTETTPSQTPAQPTETQTTPTETQTTPTETGTSTAPSGGAAPPPADTGTTTTPGGAAVPPTP